MTKTARENQPKEKGQSRWVLLASGALLLGVVLAYFLIADFQRFADEAFRVLTSDDEAMIKEWVGNFGVWGPVFIAVAMVAQMFLIVIPSVVLMVVATLAYGPLWGSLLSGVSVLLASSVAYYIGLHAGYTLVERLIGKKAEEKVEHYIQKYGAWAIVLFRVSPFLSNDAISFVAGIGEMRYPKFILATATGIIPLILMIAYVGQDTETLEKSMVWVSALTALGFLAYIIYQRAKK